MVPIAPDGVSGNENEITGRLIESASDFVIFHLIYDRNQPHLFTVKSVSPSLADILGVSDFAKFENWFENTVWEDREKLEAALVNTLKTGSFDEIFSIRHPEKKEHRWIRGFATANINGSNGRNEEPLQIMGFLFDVTDHQNLERSYEELQKDFKTITEMSPAIVFRFDLEGRITSINNCVEKILGYTQEEALGKRFQEMVAPDAVHLATKVFERPVSAGESEDLQLKIVTKDGRYVPCEMILAPLTLRDKLIGFQGLVKDINERQKAEEELEHYRQCLEAELSMQNRQLKESEARYRGIVEDLRYMVCRFLGDGMIVFSNQACKRYFERDHTKLTGRNFFQWVAEEADVKQVEAEFKACFLQKFPAFIERQHHFQNGSTRWIRWTGQRLYNKEDGFFEYQAVGQDVTEQKNSEIEKRKAEQFKRRAQKLEALGTLSAGIAHDFNNLLAVLLGNVQLIMDDIAPNSRPRNNIDEMIKAILRARDMVKQILAFSREGVQGISPISLTPVVKESVKFLRSIIPFSIEIREQIDETDFVNADPTQISQVVMNLGSNAAHAMGSDSGSFEIKLKNVHIHSEHEDRFRVSDEGKYVKMIFRDTGCGMSPEVVSRIFDPYFTTKAEGEGSGMGLAVVHGIVQAHGGSIWATSSLGEGSVFQILFPTTESEIKMDDNSADTVVGGHERILLVDDRESLLEVEKNLLKRLGYRVTATTNPIKALETFREQPHRFDLVYTDMTMPHLNGLKLSKKLIEIRPDIPIILYTGLGDLIDTNEIRSSGIRAFLEKPILLEDLASTIRRVLKNGKNERS